MEQRDALVINEAQDLSPAGATEVAHPDAASANPSADPNADPTAPAITAQPAGDRSRSAPAPRSRSSKSRHRHHGQSSSGDGGSRLDRQRRQTLIARVIAVLGIAGCVILSMLVIRARSQLSAHDMQVGTMASALNRAQSELTQTKQLVAAQEVELGALLKQRIPGVATMETEKLHDINKGYAKKLMFSEAGAGDEKHITYNIVLKNTGDRPIIPAVSILLFDRKGLQTGLAEVSPAAATIPNQSERIEPGETRAYSGLVQRIRSDPPAYYLVEVK